jgi:flagellar motor switch protein FliN
MEMDGAASEGGREMESPEGTGPIDVRLVLGRAMIPRRRRSQLRAGAVVELDRAAGDAVEVIAAGRLVARGRAVRVAGRWGVRISEVCGPPDGE